MSGTLEDTNTHFEHTPSMYNRLAQSGKQARNTELDFCDADPGDRHHS